MNELSAARVNLLRTPISTAANVPEPEASGFRVPDLPVSVQISRLAVERILLGEDVLGEPVEATAELSATLDAGALDVALDAARVDSQPGQALINLAFTPENEVLTVALDVSEPQGGVAARALTLPGLPSLDLTIRGEGPLDAFFAEIALATDGQERFGGTVGLNANGQGGRAFTADLSGDIRPLLEPSSQAFFGPETALTATGRALENGALTLGELTLSAQALSLEGSAALDAEGAPTRIALTGTLGGEGRTALPGSDVTLSGADLAVAFDAAQSDEWRLGVVAREVQSSGISLGRLDFAGEGQLLPGEAVPFLGTLTARADAVEIPEDPALSQALGGTFVLSTDLDADENGAITLRNIDLESAHFEAAGEASITPTEGRVAIAAAVEAMAADLAPFSALAGQSLAGAVTANVTAEAELPGGAVAFALTGRSVGIDIGVAELEPLLRPESTLALAVKRDESGSRIEDFRLINPEVTAEVNGSLNSQDGGLEIIAELREIGLFTDLVEGPVSISAQLTDVAGDNAIDGSLQTAFGLDARVNGALAGASPEIALSGTLAEVERFVPQLNGTAALDALVDLGAEFPELTAAIAANPGVAARVEGVLSGPSQAFDITADLEDLGAFAPPLPGPARLVARVSELSNGPLIRADVTATPGLAIALEGRPSGAQEGVTLSGTAQNLAFIAPQLAGAAEFDASLEDLSGAQRVSANFSSVTGVSAEVAGQLAEPGDALNVSARIANLARFAPGLPGGATLNADVRDLRGAPSIDATIRSDTGADISVGGQVNLPGGAVRLNAAGNAPLAVAEAFLGGRSISGATNFDLSINGPPALSSVSGSVATSGARLFDPATATTLDPINATITLAGSRATIEASAALEGTPINIAGTAGLERPFPVDIGVNASNLPVRFADILENRTSLDLALSGSADRLTVSGDVEINDTEVRIPDTGLGSAPEIPPIRHVGASDAVRQTLSRAGLDISGVASRPAPGPEIPLDITIVAATPVFVRGRGLDAGFDGTVRLTGSAADPVPIGELELTRGRLDFLGRRLDITEGRVTLAGRLIPRIDITASTTVEDITANIGLEGPVDAPSLQLSSVPELPEDEILARVLFGRGIETLSAFQVARLVNSLRQLSGAGGSGILGNAREGIGVDDIDLRTDGETGETELAIGQAISERVYTEVEIGSGGTTQLNLNFDLNDTTRLRGSASNEGETGFGVFWQRDY
ncbi:MAG: translocation/assembly module TamB domain-containing protein [Pseudomonadota bacterium]